ncbi:hypothetical protein GCM10023196_094950 [Actinoallomurus vinaceus]|uniref:Pentapeptide repeat-containing protein n=1 Tax=Actinoallomurus vinaceus TaxID=1080074 RepID=A0ABP8UVD4_9ACTN
MWAALAGTFTVAVTVLTITVWAGFALLGVHGFQHEKRLSSSTFFDLVKLAFAVVAGIAGVVALVISYRKQRLTEEADLREATKLHTDRFTAATAQLGSASPAVQLAGVHALAGLADDAPTRALRQTCIDVLCTYLHLPYDPDPAPDGLPADADPGLVKEHAAACHTYRSLREVRHTVIRVITIHLRDGTEVSWQGHDLDFTGVAFDGGDFTGAVFTDNPAKNLHGRVSFQDTTFTGGVVNFGGAKFTGGEVDFRRTKFTGGEVDFRRTKFTGGEVDFENAKFTGGRVDFGNANFISGKVNFGNADFTSGKVYFRGAKFTGGRVDFGNANFTSGKVNFRNADFTSGKVNFGGAEFTGVWVDFGCAKFTGGRVNFRGAKFTGGRVTFGAAKFAGGKVYFGGAKFAGSRVDFRRAYFITGEVHFGHAQGDVAPLGLMGIGSVVRGAPATWTLQPSTPPSQTRPDTAAQ